MKPTGRGWGPNTAAANWSCQLVVSLGAVCTGAELLLGPQSWWAGTQSGSLSLPCTAASPPFAVFPARSTRCMQKKKSTESICGKLWRSDLSCWELWRVTAMAACLGILAVVLGCDAEPDVCGRALPCASWFGFCWLWFFVFFFLF